jgi:hypothetical protein
MVGSLDILDKFAFSSLFSCSKTLNLPSCSYIFFLSFSSYCSIKGLKAGGYSSLLRTYKGLLKLLFTDCWLSLSIQMIELSD